MCGDRYRHIDLVILQAGQEVAGKLLTSLFFVDMDDERLDHTLEWFCNGNTKAESGYGRETDFLISKGLLEGKNSNSCWDGVRATTFGRQFLFNGGFAGRTAETKYRRFMEEETIKEAKAANKHAQAANSIAMAALLVSALGLLISLLGLLDIL